MALLLPLLSALCAMQACMVQGQSILSARTLPGAPPPSVVALITAGSLVIDLWGPDYDATLRLWNNRVTGGAVSVLNGDFGVVAAASINPPTLTTLAGVPAVNFAAFAGQALMTNAVPSLTGAGTAGAGFFSPMFGGAAWSTEALIMPLNDASGGNAEVGNESPYFQWGQRGAPTCTSGFSSLGHHPIWGAGGKCVCASIWSPFPCLPCVSGCITHTHPGGAVGPVGYRAAPPPFINRWRALRFRSGGSAPCGGCTANGRWRLNTARLLSCTSCLCLPERLCRCLLRSLSLSPRNSQLSFSLSPLLT